MATSDAGGPPTCYRHPDRETYIRCQRCGRPICPDCMREASVGFQCPDCVKEGLRTTRQAQGAYGGRRSGNPALTSMVLVGLNALVWLAIVATGWAQSVLINRLALLPTGQCGSREDPGQAYPLPSEELCASARTQIPDDAQWIPGVADGAFWQLLSSMFTHVEIWHLGFNMLVLWFLGPQIEAVLGRARFLALYLLSGLAGSVLVYSLAGPDSATVGASGAIFGLLGALLIIAVKVGGNVQTILGWLAVNAVFTFAVPGISWQGHLGGFLGGVAVTALLVYAPRQRRTTIQAAGLAALAAVLVAATVARTVALA